MNNTGACCTVSFTPLAPPAPRLPRVLGSVFGAGQALRRVLQGLRWHVPWRRARAVQARTQPLDLDTLSPHLARDLNLYASGDGRVAHHRAVDRYEQLRTSLPPRLPL
ncbi:MAG: hypothetical protein ACT4NV_07065 [Rhodoferax sp.]